MRSLEKSNADTTIGPDAEAPVAGETLDIRANRNGRKYSRRELVQRVLWAAAWPLFRFSPRPGFFAWRRWLLRRFGATIGKQVHICNTARIHFPWNLSVGDWSSIGDNVLVYNLGPIEIGERAGISHQAHLCAGTHDHTRADFPLRKPPIQIGDQVWIGADAFVGPGVRIGEGSVVGARAVVVKDVPAWVVTAGNPARVVKQREIISDKQRVA